MASSLGGSAGTDICWAHAFLPHSKPPSSNFWGKERKKEDETRYEGGKVKKIDGKLWKGWVSAENFCRIEQTRRNQKKDSFPPIFLHSFCEDGKIANRVDYNNSKRFPAHTTVSFQGGNILTPYKMFSSRCLSRYSWNIFFFKIMIQDQYFWSIFSSFQRPKVIKKKAGRFWRNSLLACTALIKSIRLMLLLANCSVISNTLQWINVLVHLNVHLLASM